MVCPFCGHAHPTAADRCESCGRGLPPPAAEHEDALLSRPPSTASSADEALTVGAVDAPGGPHPQLAGLLRPGHAINNRYRVIKLLGQGGMGAVYQAWDDELGIAVALKVILPAQDDPAAAAEVARRFKQELILARQITHRNVVRIYDIGEVDGVKFISMPCINGQDLSSMLRSGALSVRRALGLARQIAAGLSAAHEAGVVHRDLKPGNIMVQDDEWALLMDFGIARSVRSGTAPGTIVGTVIGTIDYMAPEQARGEVVDGRADIYAFGMILYEMLTGRRTLAGESALRDLVARMQAPPAPVRSLKPGIPEALDAIVTKCLQPDAAARYQTCAELLGALDALDADGRLVPKPSPRPPWQMLAAAALLLVGSAAAGSWWFGGDAVAPRPRDPMSVLIADFENRANDPVFERALENALSVAMEGAPFITTFSPVSARAINETLGRGTRLDEEGAKLVSRREGINVVLAGAVDLDGSRYRLTVRAIDAIPGTVLATATATASSKAEVLSAVNTVAGRLREALGDSTTESGALAASETFTAASLEAAQEYSRGQELQYAARNEEAIEAYRKALEHDPQMGRAYAGWALSAAILGRTDEAESLYKEALARLDRMTEREKFRTLGTYYNRVARNPEQAIENFALLVDRYPADASALNNLAVAHFRALNFATALEYGKRLVSVYPEQVQWRYNYALYAMYAGNFDAAREHGEEALKRNPDTPKAYLAIAMAALASGNVEDARAAWTRAAASSPQGRSMAAAGMADLALHEGRHADAIAILTPALEADRDARNTAGSAAKLVGLAEAQQMAGRTREALQAAGEALEIRRADSTLVPAARLMLAAGRRSSALALAEELGQRLNAQARAYGKLIEGEAALQDGRTVEAIETLREGVRLADLWLLRYALGVAYVGAGAHAEALSELEACETRGGEATAVFLDDEPSWRYVAPLHYWLARARDGLGLTTQAVEGYTKYVALRPDAASDPLAADARRRLGR